MPYLSASLSYLLVSPFLLRAIFSSLLFLLWLAGCSPTAHVTQVDIVPRKPTQSLAPGTHALALGATLFINREFAWRDGLLHIPRRVTEDEPVPLLVWLHGGGGHAHDAQKFFPVAEAAGVVVLALDSRHNTWDGIDSPFGPDVLFIKKALQHVFDHVWIDPNKIALGGVSDGGSYALALGRVNGTLFTHLIAVAPWRLSPPAAVLGKPNLFVAHGRRDNVYPYQHSRYMLVPSLKKAGYAVTYLEYDGPHSVTHPVSQAIMSWFRETAANAAPALTVQQ